MEIYFLHAIQKIKNLTLYIYMWCVEEIIFNLFLSYKIN